MAGIPLQLEGRLIQTTAVGNTNRGDVVIAGEIIGVAMVDRLAGSTDLVVDTMGVYRMDKGGAAFAIGDRCFYNAGLDQVTANPLDTFLGIAIAAAGGGAATVDVLFLLKYQYSNAEALAAAKAGMIFSSTISTVTTIAGAGAQRTGFRAPQAATLVGVRFVDVAGIAADAANTVQITLQNLTTAQAVATWDTTAGADGALVANVPTVDSLVVAQDALAAGDVLSLIVAKTAAGQITTQLTAIFDYTLN